MKDLELTSKEEMLSKENKAMKNKIEEIQNKMSSVPNRNKHNLQGYGQLAKDRGTN